jgi:hypothetical protein
LRKYLDNFMPRRWVLAANNWRQNAKGISQVEINYIEINFHSWIGRFPSRLNSLVVGLAQLAFQQVRQSSRPVTFVLPVPYAHIEPL